MKLALADRDAYVGDPSAMTIDLRRRCSPTIGSPTARRRSIRRVPSGSRRGSRPSGGTIYMNTADRDGLLVSLIQSNFFGAGCGLRVDEWGINLHNRGSAFNFDAGHPNAFGPSKMPLHTLIPALALRDGRPWLVFGSEGGHGQAQTHLQLLTRMLVDGDDPQAAITAPAFHDRSRNRRGSRSRTTSTRRGSTTSAAAVTTSTSCPATGTARASPTRSSASSGGYRAGSDPRAEGGVAGL